MMSKKKIYDFLRDLTANNSKEWMDTNRKRYTEAKDIWLSEIELILHRLSAHETSFEKIKPKDTIMRINNNRRFQPDKPVYKDNFAFSASSMEEASFYIHISPQESFIGGGYYRPDTAILQKIRAAIDYNGDELKLIVSTPEFKHFYNGIAPDAEQLKTSPRGYSEDHAHIDLLRRKSFTAIRPLTEKEVISDHFIDIVEEAFTVIQPFNEYLLQAVRYEE